MSRKTTIFSKVPIKKVPRNMFDLSHEVKMSGKFGYLYPVLVLEALPGDTFRDQMTAMIRFAPMLAPIMHRVDVKTDFFFVPNRLLTDFWEDFITGGQDGLSTASLPYCTPAGIVDEWNDDFVLRKGTLWDYMGLPVLEGAAPGTFDGDEKISVLPFRAYQKIYNDWFRDPNLDEEIDLGLPNTGDVSSQTVNFSPMRQRGWEKDYFTAALPWAQRGAAVLMPLAGTGSLNWGDPGNFGSVTMQTQAGGIPAAGDMAVGLTQAWTDSVGAGIHPTPESVQVEIDGASTTINDFRRTLAIQAWLENNARGGARYIDQILSHFGVRVPDYRLQRSEYLGGGRQPVVVSEVLSTANTDDVPVGDMAGHGISVGKTNRFTYRCQEHGIIIGILSIVPRTAYDQGIDKMWSRDSRYDYAFPEFANLGEQEIKSKEVFYSFADGDHVVNQSLFGYIPRYAEYKFKQNRIAGDFRDTLAFWHLSRIFTARPTLDSDFLRMQENNAVLEETYRRIFANQDGTDYLWMQLFHRLTAKRPLTYFGVPHLNG